MFNVNVTYTPTNSRFNGDHKFLIQVDALCQMWFSMMDLRNILTLSRKEIWVIDHALKFDKPIEYVFVTESEVYQICGLIKRHNVHRFEMWVRNILFPTMIERFLAITKPTPETKRNRSLLSDYLRQSRLLKEQDVNMDIFDDNNKLMEAHLRNEMERVRLLFESRKQINKRMIQGLLQETLEYSIETPVETSDLIEEPVERSDPVELSDPVERSDEIPVKRSDSPPPDIIEYPLQRSPDTTEPLDSVEASDSVEDKTPIKRSDSVEPSNPIEDETPIKRSDSVEPSDSVEDEKLVRSEKTLIELGLIEDEKPVRSKKTLIELGLIEDEEPVRSKKIPVEQPDSYPTAEDYRSMQEMRLKLESR